MSNWAMLDDGILRGKLLRYSEPCGICGKHASCLFLHHIHLEPSVAWGSILSKLKDGTPSMNVGLSCGCYAKVHRQIAHIKDSKTDDRSYPCNQTSERLSLCIRPRGHTGFHRSRKGVEWL